MKKQWSIAIFTLTLLTLSLIGVYAVSAQSQYEKLTVGISPSGDIEALAVYFTATVNGGALPYSFQWYANNTIIEDATVSHYTCNPTSAGTYLIYVTVTDSLNSSATSNIVTVTVKSYLQIDLANHNYLTTTTVGKPTHFSAIVANGTPPYKYQWYYRPYAQNPLSPIENTSEGDSSQNFTFIANSTGHYLITVRVWDSQNIEGYFMSLPPGIWVNVIEPTTLPSSNLTTIPTFIPSALPTSTIMQSPSSELTLSPSPSDIVPEFPTWIILPLAIAIALMAAIIVRRKQLKQSG